MRIGRLAIALILLVGCRLQEPDHRVGDYSPARLLPSTIGTAGTLLTSNGTSAIWSADAGGGGGGTTTGFLTVPGTLTAPPTCGGRRLGGRTYDRQPRHC